MTRVGTQTLLPIASETQSLYCGRLRFKSNRQTIVPASDLPFFPSRGGAGRIDWYGPFLPVVTPDARICANVLSPHLSYRDRVWTEYLCNKNGQLPTDAVG